MMILKEKEKGREKDELDFHTSKAIGDGGVFLHLGLFGAESVAGKRIRIYHRRSHHSPHFLRSLDYFVCGFAAMDFFYYEQNLQRECAKFEGVIKLIEKVAKYTTNLCYQILTLVESNCCKN